MWEQGAFYSWLSTKERRRQAENWDDLFGSEEEPKEKVAVFGLMAFEDIEVSFDSEILDNEFSVDMSLAAYDKLVTKNRKLKKILLSKKD